MLKTILAVILLREVASTKFTQEFVTKNEREMRRLIPNINLPIKVKSSKEVYFKLYLDDIEKDLLYIFHGSVMGFSALTPRLGLCDQMRNRDGLPINQDFFRQDIYDKEKQHFEDLKKKKSRFTSLLDLRRRRRILDSFDLNYRSKLINGQTFLVLNDHERIDGDCIFKDKEGKDFQLLVLQPLRRAYTTQGYHYWNKKAEINMILTTGRYHWASHEGFFDKEKMWTFFPLTLIFLFILSRFNVVKEVWRQDYSDVTSLSVDENRVIEIIQSDN